MCRRSGPTSWLRSRPHFSVPVLATLLLLVPLSVAAQQTAPEPTQQKPGIEQLLQTAMQLSQLLLECETALTNSEAKISDLRQRFETLKADYAAVQTQLTAALLSSESSAQQIVTLSALSDKLKAQLDQLSMDFEAYKQQAQSNYNAAVRERDTWKAVAATAGVVAVIAIVVAAVK